jgi:hypothetical protein
LIKSVSTSGEVKDGVEVRGDGDQECLLACLRAPWYCSGGGVECGRKEIGWWKDKIW